MLLSWNGTKPITLKNDTERFFIEDNDTLILRGYCQPVSPEDGNDRVWIGFGECSTKLLPAISMKKLA